MHAVIMSPRCWRCLASILLALALRDTEDLVNLGNDFLYLLMSSIWSHRLCSAHSATVGLAAGVARAATELEPVSGRIFLNLNHRMTLTKSYNSQTL